MPIATVKIRQKFKLANEKVKIRTKERN